MRGISLPLPCTPSQLSTEADTWLQKVCVNNMLGQASQLGCSAGDIVCLCKNVNFGNGIKDCATESCPSANDAANVQSAGMAICASYLAAAASAAAEGARSASMAATSASAGAASASASASSVSGSMASSMSSMASSLSSSAAAASSGSSMATATASGGAIGSGTAAAGGAAGT